MRHFKGEYGQQKRKRMRKGWIVYGLACVVALCTVSALTLPAITLESSGCAIPEHSHIQECYTHVTSTEKRVPACNGQTLSIHQHTQECYGTEGNLQCGQADSVAHKHDTLCYDEEGNLWCTLPEVEAHIHGDSCYAAAEAGHTHTEPCYTRVRGELICTEHVHTDDCYTENSILVCTEEHGHGENCNTESSILACTEEHEHGETCYTENPIPVCTEEHGHNENCYNVQRVLSCGVESDHQHTDSCYTWQETLICGLSTEPVSEPTLICSIPQMPAHQHSDDCFAPGEPEPLTCTLPVDENHTHTALCYGTWELTCGMEEHTHTLECSADPTADVETAQQWEQTFADVRLTGEWPVDVLAIAKTQLGYEESEKNYVLKEDGTHAGYTRYGAWYGGPYGDWCAMFVSFCIHYADVEEMPLNAGCIPWIQELAKVELYHAAHTEEAYIPAPGDLVFFDWEGDGLSDHVGLVMEIRPATDEEPAKLISIEGNSSNRVQCVTYDLDASEILGFGQLPEQSFYCGKTGHAHTDECGGEGACLLEGHTHSAACQPVETVPKEVPGSTEEIVYFCDKTEHLHSEFCLNENGNLTCGLEEHTHGEACTQEVYYCGLTEHTHDDLCIDEEGNLICELIEHTHDALCSEVLTPEQLQDIEDAFRREVEALEALDELTEDDRLEAEDLLTRMSEAFRIKRLSEDAYLELYDRVESLLESDADEEMNSIAEACVGSNWIALRDSGWFQEYSGCTARPTTYDWSGWTPSPGVSLMASDEAASSAQQIDSRGGENANVDDGVYVSKTIDGTETENVFDITLTVQTPQVIDEVIKEPDMAVVIVMDISNTMKSNFGDSTRYEAAMLAAEEFLDNFATNNSMGVSKVGYVAFNTDGHKIFDLQPCTSTAQAGVLKNTMRTVTGNIINQDGYGEWNNPNKFTNMEAGLAVARDMFAGVTNKNKYVIFLSDGFPTTYIKSGYTGHVPIHQVSDDTHNYIRDDLYPQKPFTYGTNYSDRGAVKAREMATAMKDSGITIFSIGVNVSGQSLETYITQSEEKPFSTMDRTSATYDIGGTGTGYFENWLRDSIGSGYYYDSTNTAGLKDAYNQIFTTIKESIETASDADWVAKDPIPATTPDEVEFIGLYSKDNALQATSISGTHAENAENTASYGTGSTISWDLKTSGYTKYEEGNRTTYTYTLKYRVRLKNEDAAFVENKVYNTNGKTTLQYRVVKTVNSVISISDPKTIEFPVPSVHGYLAELTFTKQDSWGNALAGAEFTLNHDAHCRKCHGDNTPVTLISMVAVSDENGTVTFRNIPSGHTYTLIETDIPPGYSSDGTTYAITVAYDKLTVEATNNGVSTEWKGIVVNNTYYELPATGGTGTTLYTVGGTLLMAAVAYLLYIQYKHRKEERSTS